MNPLAIVGELNPYGANPHLALYHLPRHASGNRLREHLGLSDVVYEGLHRFNLCTGKWSLPAARERAELLSGQYETIVCLGAKVRKAFDGPPFWQAEKRGNLILVTLPHPSGLNLMWNDKDARAKARAILKAAAPSFPWGEHEDT